MRKAKWYEIFFIGIVFFITAYFVKGAFALFSTQTTNAGNTFSTGFWVTPTVPTPTITLTPTLTPTPTISQNVVINELMWMGSSVSTADEWIELKNTTSTSINIGGWKLLGAAESAGIITIPLGKTILANGFFVIANNNASNSILAITPDIQTASVSLSNDNLQVTLKDSLDNTIDTAWNGTAPTVGSNVAPKKSMERNATPGDGTLPANWHTSSGSIHLDPGATESATPRSENSI